MRCLTILSVILLYNGYFVECGLNYTEYYKIPKIYELDNYDRCLQEFPDNDAAYCYVDVTIKPDPDNYIWNIISKLTNDEKHYFRHDRLKRGICIEWCREELSQLDNETANSYYEPLFVRDMKGVTLHPGYYDNITEYRRNYNRDVNMCVNRQLQMGFNLTAFSEVEYCVTRADDKLKIDVWDWLFLLGISLLLKITFSASIYDWRMQSKFKRKPAEHYTTPPVGVIQRLLVAFSLVRNWYKFVGPSNDHSLKTINTLRFAFMLLVVGVHTLFFHNGLPIFNTERVEAFYHNFSTILLINGTVLMQSFFCVSGFLLGYFFFKYVEGESFHWSYFWVGLVYRYIRLAPVYIFTIFLNATWMYHLSSGPVWKGMTQLERNTCRRNWWTNLLYINNYVELQEPCIQQAWYLAVDFHVWCLALIGFMVIWKMPKTRNFIFAGGIVLACFLVGYETYVNKFEGIEMHLLECQKYLLVFDKVYNNIHISSHTNIGNYWIGIVFGYIYYVCRKKGLEYKNNVWYNLCFWLWIPLLFANVLSGYIFFINDFEKPAIWISIYAALFRHLWGLGIAFILLGFGFRVGWILRNLMNHHFFIVMGRAAYCVFLTHSFIIRVFLGNMRQPFFFSETSVLRNALGCALMAYAFGMIVYLLIEIPFSNLQKLLVHSFASDQEHKLSISNSDTKTSSEKYICNNNNNNNNNNDTLRAPDSLVISK